MKEEKTIEQALKDAAEQAGAKPEEMKTVAVEQVAGIHVFSSDMEKPPIVLIDGEFVNVATLLGYAISEFIDGAVAQGTQRAHVERFMVGITQKAIATSRAEAYRKAVQEGDTINGTVMAGQIAGLVTKEQTCKEMIDEMMEQADKLLGGCQK